MLLKISLHSFRNFKKREFFFSPETTAIIGPNASGKTNILEAINLLSTGKSFKVGKQEEMIGYGEEVARVKGGELEVVLTRGVITRGNVAERTAGKRLFVKGVGKRLIDFAGRLKVVSFRPQDIDLVTGSPSKRRDFMDGVLGQIDYEYRRNLLSYEKGLKRRNRVLWLIRDEGASVSQLAFWDSLLIKNADYIARERFDLVRFVNSSEWYRKNGFMLHYDKSVISAQRLDKYRGREIAAGQTLVGPHRDDLMFMAGNRELDKYGSRGEQRMVVLWLKLAELLFVEEKTGEKPVLLLDDIFSELDGDNRALIKEISNSQQTIVTTTDEDNISDFSGAKKINV